MLTARGHALRIGNGLRNRSLSRRAESRASEGARLPRARTVKIGLTSRLGGLGLSILACGAGILLILWGNLIVEAAQQRELRIAQAGRDTANLAIAFREHISRTMTALDQIMLAIKAEHEAEPERFEIPQWLDHSSFLAGLVMRVSLADAGGRIRATNAGAAADRPDIVDRQYFRHHLDADAAQPYIGAPLLGRLSGRWAFQVSRRLERADGSFAGIVVVSIEPSYLGQFFETVDLGPRGVAILVGRDGIVRARRAGADTSIGQNIDHGHWREALGESAQATLIGYGAIDGVERIRTAMAVP